MLEIVVGEIPLTTIPLADLIKGGVASTVIVALSENGQLRFLKKLDNKYHWLALSEVARHGSGPFKDLHEAFSRGTEECGYRAFYLFRGSNEFVAEFVKRNQPNYIGGERWSF